MKILDYISGNGHQQVFHLSKKVYAEYLLLYFYYERARDATA